MKDRSLHVKKSVVFTYQNIIIFASLLPIVLFGFLTYNNSKDDATKATSEHIKTINLQNKKLIQAYFTDLEFNVHELTKTISFLEEQAKNNITTIQLLQKENIQEHYRTLENNLISLSKKDIFQYIYSFLQRGKIVNSTYFDNIKTYKDTLGLKNILMINNDGKILYSSDQKELQSTYIKEFSSSFERIFSELRRNEKDKNVHFINFIYEKSSKRYKQYAITRFKDVSGFIALEVNQDNLQKSVENTVSLGDSAETYLVYKEGMETYLGTNRVKKKGKVGDKKSGLHIEKGFNSQGVDIKYGSQGDIELVSYIPIKIKNITLSMQTTVAYTDIISPIIKGSDYFEQFVKDYAYHNIMMIDPKGEIFYSIGKEDDYKTNVFDGKYADTHLLKVVKEVLKTKKFVLSDLNFYAACTDGLAQFALLPVLKNDGSIQSIVAIQLESDYLTDLLQKNNSIYHSYETYVVGEDKRLRSDTTLSINTHNVKKSFFEDVVIDTKAVKDAFKIGNGVDILEDYRGIEVLSSFNTLKYGNFEWAVITEVDATEIEKMLSGLKNNILIFVFISSLVAFFVMIVITNEKKKQDKKLSYTATHDNLTGLPNRKFALEFLSLVLAHQKRKKTKGAVLFIDLDKFKIINDSYGHDAGDDVLIEISKRLKKMLREEDLVARLGGDEFIVILSNFAMISEIDKLCKKLITVISEPIEDTKRNKIYEVGISVGISIFPEDSNKAEELLQFADTAMFRTKDDGRNGFTYYNKEMTEKFLQISRVEDELKYAIENNELELYYQPQIDLEAGRIVGVEALVRWNHPRDGLIMPNDFIPIAEDSNLIIDLGLWVTAEACKNFKQWKDAGVNIDYIAVNMSTKQLQSSKCIDYISEIFHDLNFKPDWLELEITENTLISNMESTITNVNTFKEMGIKFSIDDFGTGYSSLSYLKSLQISTLKIDREFIKDIMSDKDDRSIVTAIIAMAHKMNYTVVAEGVEKKEEVVLLEYLACDLIQGYYYSKPLQEADLLQYIKNKEWVK